MSWDLSCNQYSLRQTVPNRVTFHQTVRRKTCVLRDAIGTETPMGPFHHMSASSARGRLLRSDRGCLPHYCGTAVSALATRRSSGKGANGGHRPRRGARCAESIALALEPGQGPQVPNQMYQNERFCRPPIDLLMQWRRTLHNRVMRALEPKKAARYLQLESKIRTI